MFTASSAFGRSKEDSGTGRGGDEPSGRNSRSNFTEQGEGPPQVSKNVKNRGFYSGGTAGFNPEPMEHAARLAEKLDRERNPTHFVYEEQTKLAKEQSQLLSETNKLVQQAADAAEIVRHDANESNARMRSLKVHHDKKRDEFKDKLKRIMASDMKELKRIERAKKAEIEEAAHINQEKIRRETLEFEARLRQKTDEQRVLAETDGRIMAERQNHDLRLEQYRQSARETRQTVLAGIKLAGEAIGSGAVEFLGNRQEMTAVVATLTAAAVGIYSARTGTRIAGKYVEARLGKPSLVRETSHRSVLNTFRHPFASAQRLFRTVRPGDALEGDGQLPRAIFVPAMEERLRRIAESAANTKANRAPFRHLLLHGPPGTGKTLFAKGLARHSGLDYAVMTGGDVAPLGREGVSEMHKLFDWAQVNRRGVLLFVDEADAFLRRRSTEAISEDMRNALNAFLYRTGEQTDKFMLVYASNQPEQFDDAVNDRIDEMVQFGLPGVGERYRMLTHYMNKYLLKERASKEAAVITINGIEERHIREAAEATVGFSGRELSKLTIAWQAAAYGTDPAVFTPDVMASVTESFLEQKAMKLAWDTDALANFNEDGARS